MTNVEIEIPNQKIKSYLEDLMNIKISGKTIKVSKEKEEGIIALIRSKLIEEELGVF